MTKKTAPRPMTFDKALIDELRQYKGGQLPADPVIDALDRALETVTRLTAERAALREALKRVELSHHTDTCESQLIEGGDCTCHVKIARGILHTEG